MPLLYDVVHESMRLAHGIVIRDPRLAPDEELRYGKWVIPRNIPVSMTTYNILINEEIFPEPKKIKPERWVDHPELDKYFVPFGKGSRQSWASSMLSSSNFNYIGDSVVTESQSCICRAIHHHCDHLYPVYI